MRIFLTLALLFIFVPWVEIAILIRLAQTLGFVETLGIVLLTGLVGAALARQQGLQSWARVRQALRGGQSPSGELVHAFLIFCAGLLLATPGILTDAVGFSLLVPPWRKWLVRAATRAAKKRFRIAEVDVGSRASGFREGAESREDGGAEAIDVEARDVEIEP